MTLKEFFESPPGDLSPFSKVIGGLIILMTLCFFIICGLRMMYLI